MDYTMTLRHLHEAEGHVAQGERLIIEQEARIVELDRDGHDTVTAHELLANLRASQVQHVEHRNRILQELKELEQ